VAAEKFRINVPEAALSDLRDRLRRTRRVPFIANAGWADGTDDDYLQALLHDWAETYDWRAREAALNRLPNFIADIDGFPVHFIHARGEGPAAVPLLLLHGWPSSIVQMLDIIPLLNAGSPSFDVVAVSLPGNYPSAIPATPGMSFARIAGLLTRLMVEVLGYQRFAARGSDQGALVQQQIGLQYADRLIFLHRSGISPYLSPMPVDLSPAETAYQARIPAWGRTEQLYAQLQAGRPETLLPALSDSPAGLAAWIIEKFQRWGDCPEGLDACFGRERLLDNLTLHWFGHGAAIRLYREWARDPGLSGRINVPSAFLMPLRDGAMIPAPRAWVERFYNVRRWTIMPRGGHFPEWERPAEVAADIQAFAAALAANQG